jgi:hypothetical protein
MPTQQQCNNQLPELVNMNAHLLKPWSLRKSVIKLFPQLIWSCCTLSLFCMVRSAPSRCFTSPKPRFTFLEKLAMSGPKLFSNQG